MMMKIYLKIDSSKLNLSQSEYIRNLIVGYEIKIETLKILNNIIIKKLSQNKSDKEDVA